MRSKKLLNILGLFVLTFGVVGVAMAQPPIPPFPTNVTAANGINIVKTVWAVAYGAQATNAAQSIQIAALQTAVGGGTAQPPATPTLVPAATQSPATATNVPNGATVTPAPTVGAATITPMPTPTTPPAVVCLNCVSPDTIVPVPNPVPNVRGMPCPAWAHDLYLIVAPNGLTYRTWHPSVQPDSMAGAGCKFDHEHGLRDPRGSKADPSLPAYGYVADVHGMTEPHSGFKTEYANAGERNEFESFNSTSDVKATLHQGTFGMARVTQRFHTMEFDLKNSNGAEVHVKGMGDTGLAGNQCNPPDQENGTVGVRFFALPFAKAKACGLGTPYEVWEWAMPIGANRFHAKLGVFDAITVLNPATGLLEPTGATWQSQPQFSGCKHDLYYGPIYINANVNAVDSFGIKQFVKAGSVATFPLDTAGKSAFKLPYDDCASEPYTNN